MWAVLAFILCGIVNLFIGWWLGLACAYKAMEDKKKKEEEQK